jgi:hypothetical protein
MFKVGEVATTAWVVEPYPRPHAFQRQGPLAATQSARQSIAEFTKTAIAANLEAASIRPRTDFAQKCTPALSGPEKSDEVDC